MRPTGVLFNCFCFVGDGGIKGILKVVLFNSCIIFKFCFMCMGILFLCMSVHHGYA